MCTHTHLCTYRGLNEMWDFGTEKKIPGLRIMYTEEYYDQVMKNTFNKLVE